MAHFAAAPISKIHLVRCTGTAAKSQAKATTPSVSVCIVRCAPWLLVAQPLGKQKPVSGLGEGVEIVQPLA
jgi:hypothetical protein